MPYPVAAVRGKNSGTILPSYSSILINTYGASEVWPLVDISNGTTIFAKVSAAQNGILSGWDLQNVSGPVVSTLAPYVDGVDNGDYGNIASIDSIFNGAIGSALIFGKVSDASVWSDGVQHYLFKIQVNGNNTIYAYKHQTLGFDIFIAIGGNPTIIRQSTTTTDWFCVGLSWKDSANGNEVKGYFNGSQYSTTKTGFGAWSGTPTIKGLLSAAGNVGPSPWKGWGAYFAVKFGSIWTATDFANMYAARLNAGPENPM